MKLTTSQGLPYPEDNDIGNGAAYLQALAEAAETKLLAEDALLDEAELPDTLIVRRSTAITGIAASPGYTIVKWDQVLYDNKGAMTGVTLPASARMMRSGVYGIGFYLAHTVTGGVVTNSRRNAELSWSFAQGPSVIDVFDYFVSQDVIESNTGGEFQTLYSTVEVPSQITGSPVDMMLKFFHTNTGATLNIGSGSFAYYHRIRPLEVG